MKKIIFLLFCFSMFACKKHQFNYRRKYTGDYNFTVNYHSWVLYGVVEDTTYTYNGTIDFGSQDTTIVITFSKNNSVECTLNKDGAISTNYSPHIWLKGQFESKEKLSFEYANSGLGGGGNYKIEGEKIK